MRSPNPKIAVLRRVPGLAGHNDADLVRLAALVDEVDVPVGKVLTETGGTGRQSFIVVEGWASVSRDGEVIAAVGPGEFIGEMAMLDHQPRSATVVAKTPMRLLVLGPGTFSSFVAEPGIGREMAVGLAKRLRDLEAKP